MPEPPGTHYQAPEPQGAPESGGVILRDGTTATLRPARPDDSPLLRDFLGRISRESYVRRFYAETPVQAAASRMLEPKPPEQKLVLFVLTGDPERARLVATGEYAREAPGSGRISDSAEVAFLVDDALHGKGLGTLLLERLALVAARHGITRFTALTMARNRPMLSMFASSGFTVRRRLEYGDVELDFSILPSRESVARAEGRERVATVASLYPFFKPRAVAVLGRSAAPESASQRVLRNVREGFAGGVYLVNPNLEGAYPSLEALPEPVDLAILALPKDAVLEAVDACGAAGVRALIVLSAGFAEAGAAGAALQKLLAEKVRGHGMRLVGPNSLGLINVDPALNASLAPRPPRPGGVAVASQSGALGLASLEHAAAAGLGVASFVSLGNKADVSGNDLLGYWEDDAATRLILFYLASFGNPRRFARLARRVGRKKPILVVKAGPADAAVDALFRQTGVVRAGTFEETLEVATLLAHQPLPAGPRVGVLTNASGPAALAVDTLRAAGLELPALPEAACAHLAPKLPEGAVLANPLDLSAFASAEHYREALRALFSAPALDTLLVLFSPVGPASAGEVGAVLGEVVAHARAEGNPKPVLLCFTGAHPPLYAGAERLPSYRFPESAARALARAHEYARWRREPLGETPDFPDLDVPRAREVLRTARARGGGWLLPGEVAAVLAAFGLPGVPGRFAQDAEAVVLAAEALGFPVALKLASSTLVEKSLWDGVKLGLADAGAVRRAAGEITARLQGAGKGEELAGFWVQEMVPGGTELVIGVRQDPLFGPLLSFGLGGLYTEVLQDKAVRITPLTDRGAAEMIGSVRSFPLLVGYRGHPSSDLVAVRELLLRVSRLVEELPEITELDLNPVKAFEPGEGALVLDARIRVGSEEASG